LLSGNEIPPGGEGKIAVTARTGNQRRNFRQIVNVQTNDPANASIRLTITANILVDLEVVPALLRFEPARSETASVKIKSYANTAVHLSDIHSSNEDVNISVSSMTIPPKGEVLVTAKLLAPIPRGVFSGWLKIRTDLKSFPMIQIRLWGNNP
jgi:hypothetical protein